MAVPRPRRALSKLCNRKKSKKRYLSLSVCFTDFYTLGTQEVGSLPLWCRELGIFSPKKCPAHTMRVGRARASGVLPKGRTWLASPCGAESGEACSADSMRPEVTAVPASVSGAVAAGARGARAECCCALDARTVREVGGCTTFMQPAEWLWCIGQLAQGRGRRALSHGQPDGVELAIVPRRRYEHGYGASERRPVLSWLCAPGASHALARCHAVHRVSAWPRRVGAP